MSDICARDARRATQRTDYRCVMRQAIRTAASILALGAATVFLAPVSTSAQAETGQMRLTIIATPETASTIVPFVSLNGTDVFATNCVAAPEFDLYTSEKTYQCSGLELAVYDVGAPPIDGVPQSLRCSPVGSFEGFDFSKADVAVDGYVYCSLAVYPPGLRVDLYGADPATAVDTIIVLDETGNAVDAHCRRVESDGDVPTLHCDPLALGIYTMPDQAIDASGELQPISCLPGLGFGLGPESSNVVTLEQERNEVGIDFSVWSCVAEAPPPPERPSLALSIDADPAIADDLQIELRQNDIDIRGDACAPATASGYLDSGLDGNRYFQCTDDWSGDITPLVVNAPDTHLVEVVCFEENPVSGGIGPSATFDDDTNSHWVCSITVLEPSILVAAPFGSPALESLTLVSEADSALAAGETLLACRPDARGSATGEFVVADCARLPKGTFTVAGVLDASGAEIPLDCFAFRSLLASEPGSGPSVVYDGAPETALWTCVLAEPLLDDDPDVDQLPATGRNVPTWMTPLALLLIVSGMGLVMAGRRRPADR